MNKDVIIIGASGHGEVVADLVLKSNDKLIGFLDDNEKLKEFAGYPVLGKTSEYIQYLNAYFVIAIGNPQIRERFAKEMTDKVKWYTGIHPSAQLPFGGKSPATLCRGGRKAFRSLAFRKGARRVDAES